MPRAIRALAARPGFTVVVVLTLAVGFGVNAAIFSVTRTVLLRPLPYRDADRLVQIGEVSPVRGVSYLPVVPANYAAWKPAASAFEDTAAWRVVYFALSGQTKPIRVQGVRVASSFFRILGITPTLGRNFTDDEDLAGRDDVVLLSHGFWERQFGADASIVGRTVRVDGTPCTVIGILPDSFKFFRVLNRELDVWRPLPLERSDREHSINLLAKLNPGVTLDSARAELTRLYSSLPRDGYRDGWSADLWLLSTRFSMQARPVLAALELAVALVMGIAGANIANLILAVGVGRRKDVAVRVALGATPWRLAAELGRETVVLAGLGAALGVLLAVWMIGVLNSSVSYQDVNRIEPFRIDFWVLMLTLGLAIASALVFALLPARTAADADVIDALKDSSHGVSAGPPNRRLRAALVIGELALSIVLVTAAVHLTRSALALTGMNRGLDVDRVMTAQLSLNAPRYDDVSRRTQFGDAVLRRLTSAAGIESASLVNYPPLSLIGTGVAVAVEGQAAPPGQEPMAQYWIVAPRYFETLGVRLLAGRDFTAADSSDRLGVAIVSQRFVEHFWGRGDAVGEHVTPLFPPSDAYWMPRASSRPLTIVGVVGDVSEQGIPGFVSDSLPQLYLPYSQNPTRIMTLVTRASGDPLGAAAVLRDAVQSADPDQPTFDEKSLDAVRRETFARPREIAWLIGAFALLALVLSAIGVYGVMAYLATARTQEIRIRVALGAGRADVVRLVVADGLRLTAAGVGVGVIAAPLALRAAKGWVFGVDSLDPVTLAAVAAVLTLVAVAASAVPADHAARIADVSRSLG